jgi:hypothetical protein
VNQPVEVSRQEILAAEATNDALLGLAVLAVVFDEAHYPCCTPSPPAGLTVSQDMRAVSCDRTLDGGWSPWNNASGRGSCASQAQPSSR